MPEFVNSELLFLDLLAARRRVLQLEAEAARYRSALELERTARKFAQRCVGSLPGEMAQRFENLMAQTDLSTERALAASSAQEPSE